MKILKMIITWTYSILLVCILSYFLGMHFFPEQISKVAGYRFYDIVTNSMEPTIPTNSLVLTKLVKEDTKIKPNTIITFHANRLDNDIVLTHYFKETQVNEDGVTMYRTHAEGKTELDGYETTREDIIGTYVGHVPYLGKIFRFLQSMWGMMTLAMMIVVLIINHFISMRLNKSNEKENKVVFHKEKKKQQKQSSVVEEISIVCDEMLVQDQYMILRGKVCNHTKHTIYFLRVKIIYQDQNEQHVDTNLWYMVGREGLAPGEEKKWTNTIIRSDVIEKCQFEIVSCKQALRKKG